MQEQIKILQQLVLSANQMIAQTSNAYENLTSSQIVLDVMKPDKFHRKNVGSWLQSLDNYFPAQRVELSDRNGLGFAVGYMYGGGLQWWELLSLQHISINTYLSLKEKLLHHFKPVNREVNSRKRFNQTKQMDKYRNMEFHNYEFSRYILKIPTMATAEQIFHYSKGLKARVKNEVERS